MKEVRNPFEFGRELSGTELVDREEELQAVVKTMTEGGRLFLIGPRRFGKTSILRVAAERAEQGGAVVLRYDAEAYPLMRFLAEALVAAAAARLTGPVERVGQKIRDFFGKIRPQLSFDPLTQTFSAAITTESRAREASLLTDVLDGLNGMAADSGRRVAVVIDEFQHVVEQGEGGALATERQLRAAVQKHDHVSYVFAGSKTGLLSEMTGNASRPFYRLGSRLFIGALPRTDFGRFLRSGFESAGFRIEDDAVEAILDLSEDVPYNVQRLAHACWSEIRDRHKTGAGHLTAMDAFHQLETLVRRDDPFYTQIWNRLTASQQKALLAIVETQGKELYSREVLQGYQLPLSTMRTATESLVKSAVVRQDESMGAIRHRLEDPFMAAWLRLFAVGR